MDIMGTGDLIKHLRIMGLAVTERRLDFHIRAGHIQEPTTRICGARVWTSTDVETVVAFFGQAQEARSRIVTGGSRD